MKTKRLPVSSNVSQAPPRVNPYKTHRKDRPALSKTDRERDQPNVVEYERGRGYKGDKGGDKRLDWSLGEPGVNPNKEDRLPNRSLGGGYKEDPQTLRDRILISDTFRKSVSKRQNYMNRMK